MLKNNLLFTQSPLLLFTLLLLLTTLSILLKSYIPLFMFIPTLILLIYFYRFPDRKCLSRPKDITSPADGTVTNIITNPKTKRKTVSIFLSPLDVHVQYLPFSGRILSQTYKEGTFHPAYLFKKSEHNECNIVAIQTQYGVIKVTQIAGIIARRIVSTLQPNQQVTKGTPYGMIKLSSRVDIELPPNTEILVSPNEHIKGCETTIAKFTIPKK
jgi:phosphatidylserine decarboxylase